MTERLRTKTTLVTAALMAILLLATGCGTAQEPASSNAAGNKTTEYAANAGPANQTTTAPSQTGSNQDEYDRALEAKGLVTGFIGEQFYDQPVENEESALAAVKSALERVGGDETTILEFVDARPTETGTTYYTFRQRAGDVSVYGASVKLVVDKDHKAIGLVSALLPNVHIEDLTTWEVTAEQAEKVVQDNCTEKGSASAKIVSGATEQTLIALSDNAEKRRYAWVVYTNNYLNDVDAGYLAHYVSADGDYLYAIPVGEPGNADSLAGDKAAFDFDKMKEGTWTGNVTKYDGSTMEITVPTLIDPDTGDVYLGDAKRKILCADYAEFTYNEKLAPRTEGDKGFANNELIIYNTFIKIWDFYDSIGWHGPDDEGSPTLLKMDMVDKNGEVEHNAYYQGRTYGFQCFAFNRDEPDGECVDIMAHEFTHCVTGTTMTANLYLNDTGAINEGMSDIMGNLVEMITAYDEKGAWIIGENGITPLRSIKEPHAYHQPEYVWDEYYGPAVGEGTVANDRGGVHINMSLLSFVSYKLDQAGMSPEDQFYFWMNVALAMTPSTDYPQMAELLPWCMEQSGYTQYVDAVKKAVEETRIAQTEVPSTTPEGCGFVKVELTEQALAKVNNIRLVIVPFGGDPDKDSSLAWAGANANNITATLPAGDYTVFARCFEGYDVTAEILYTESGWVNVKEESSGDPKVFSITAGETTELPGTGLVA